VRLEAAGVPCGSGTAWAEYEPRIRARLGRQSGWTGHRYFPEAGAFGS